MPSVIGISFEFNVASALQETAALTPYGVDIRYPADQPEPNATEARQALELARQVHNVVTPVLSSDAAS